MNLEHLPKPTCPACSKPIKPHHQTDTDPTTAKTYHARCLTSKCIQEAMQEMEAKK